MNLNTIVIEKDEEGLREYLNTLSASQIKGEAKENFFERECKNVNTKTELVDTLTKALIQDMCRGQEFRYYGEEEENLIVLKCGYILGVKE